MRRLLAWLAFVAVIVPAAAGCDSEGTSLPPPATRTVSPSVSPSPSPSARPVVPTTAPPTSTAAATRTPTPAAATRTPTRARPTASPTRTSSAPRPLPAGDDSLFVLGDSVLISAEPYVRSALPGWVITYDAEGSRRLPQGIQVLRARRSEIGRAVVIQQGNNYIASEGSFGSQIDEAMSVLRGTARVVWLTVAEKWPSRVEINKQIRAAAGRWPTIVVGDWASLVAAHPDYAGDELHLSPSGRRAMAALIARCVGPAP